jgi:hypothetical protein
MEVFNDRVVGREEPDGVIPGLGAGNSSRTYKFNYPYGSGATVSSSKIVLESSAYYDKFTGEKDRSIQVKVVSGKATGTMCVVVVVVVGCLSS